MISIIIPTRNRPVLLKGLVEELLKFDKYDFQIIVVDSSDESKRSSFLGECAKVKYLTTSIKSAAIQRNLGLDNLSNTKYVFFLDDDVLPDAEYFDRCILNLENAYVVGVSGLALKSNSELRSYPKSIIGIFQRLFLLDSNQDGKLLRSGVNIPVRSTNHEIREVSWLIGCSAWKASMIGSTRFESDFFGQSLGEDVIFSIRMGKKGMLLTDPQIILDHLESDIERPNKKEFWKMWVINRRRIIEVADFGFLGLIAFWWSNFGQLVILSYSKLRNPTTQKGAVSGFFLGCLNVLGVEA